MALQVTAAGASASVTFASGVSRLELLVRAARIVEGMAASKHAGGAPQDALALRLLTIQVRIHSQAQTIMGIGCLLPGVSCMRPFSNC